MLVFQATAVSQPRLNAQPDAGLQAEMESSGYPKPCFRTENSASCREQCDHKQDCRRIIAEWLRYR